MYISYGFMQTCGTPFRWTVLHLKQIRTLKSLGCDNHLFDFQQKHHKLNEHSIRVMICMPFQCVFSSSILSWNFVHQIECSSLLQYLIFNHFFSANSFHIEHIREWRMTFKIRIQILVVRFGANDTRSYRKKTFLNFILLSLRFSRLFF